MATLDQQQASAQAKSALGAQASAAEKAGAAAQPMTKKPGNTFLYGSSPATMSEGSGPTIQPPGPPPPGFPGIQPTQPQPAPATQYGGGVSGQAIDPANSLRQQVLTPTQVNTQMTPGQTSWSNTATPGQVTPANIDVSGFNINSGALSRGSAMNAQAQSASGGRNLAFKINPQSVLDNAMQAFQAQLPGLNQDFADKSEQLAKGTSAMGRTGSGLFNRDTGFISDRARSTREGLLGNLAFQGATSDQGADLQAQMTTQNLLGQQENRFANTNVANMQSANQLAGQNAQGQNQMSMQNSQNSLQAMLANQRMNADAASQNAQLGMQGQLANQSANMQNNQFNAQMGQQNQQFNAGNDMQSQMFNIQNQIQQGQFGANFMAGQQQNQNQMAQQAQNDYFQQLQLMGQQAFANNPAQAQAYGAQGYGNLAEMYGANATQTGNQMQGAVAGGVDLAQQLMAGWNPGQATAVQQPGPLPALSQQPKIMNDLPPGLTQSMRYN